MPDFGDENDNVERQIQVFMTTSLPSTPERRFANSWVEAVGVSSHALAQIMAAVAFRVQFANCYLCQVIFACTGILSLLLPEISSFDSEYGQR